MERAAWPQLISYENISSTIDMHYVNIVVIGGSREIQSFSE